MSGTAEIYDAVLDPGKLDLLRGWVRRQDWFDGDPESLEQVTAYRFVDPDGEVGMESFLLSDGSRTYHVPVTYRGAERPDFVTSPYGSTMRGEARPSVLRRYWISIRRR